MLTPEGVGQREDAAMNQASMFFTAMVMLAGAGWYVMAQNPDMIPKPGAEAKMEAPARATLVARGAAPVSARELDSEPPPPAR